MSSHAQLPKSAPDRLVRLEDDLSRLRTGFAFSSLPLDAIVLTVLLGGLNFFVSPDDPGWMNLNPTPWILLPMILGGRYGTGGGTTGILVAIAALVGLIFATGGRQPPFDLISSRPYFFLGLIGAGVISSLIHALVAGRVRRLRSLADKLETQNTRLQEDCILYRENEAALQESLLLHGAEYASLTEAMAHLFSTEKADIESGLLEIFHQQLGVTASSIYVRPEGSSSKDIDSFQLAATRGNPEQIPDNVPGSQNPMFSKAVEEEEVIASTRMTGPRETNELEDRADPILAVIPWGTRPGQTDALCVLFRMAFDRVSWESLSRIEAVFDWAMARRQHQGTGFTSEENQILGPHSFFHRFDQAKQAATSLNLESRMIIFAPLSERMDSTAQTQFVESLQELIRRTDCLGAITSMRGDYAIGLLTLAGSEKAAELYASRLIDQAAVTGIGFQIYEIFDPVLEAALNENCAVAQATEDSSSSSSRERTTPTDTTEATVVS
ncbi:MAG: hypothetical protein HKN23_04885 [Verrucomicrobiales bacterium]|nr:hypothetical protein [Verrucomicrobiales bacterium]